MAAHAVSMGDWHAWVKYCMYIVVLQRMSTAAVNDRLQAADTDSDTLRGKGQQHVYTSQVGLMSLYALWCLYQPYPNPIHINHCIAYGCQRCAINGNPPQVG